MSWYCTRCGNVGWPKKKKPGSFVMTLFLLLFFIIPGLFYIVWRSSNRYRVCRSCGSRDVVPSSSPIAKSAMAHASAGTRSREDASTFDNVDHFLDRKMDALFHKVAGREGASTFDKVDNFLDRNMDALFQKVSRAFGNDRDR